MAQVRADGNRVKLEKVWSGVDCGPVINLSGAKNQVEGAIVDALSTAQLELSFSGGAIEQSNFSDYMLAVFLTAAAFINLTVVDTYTELLPPVPA